MEATSIHQNTKEELQGLWGHAIAEGRLPTPYAVTDPPDAIILRWINQWIWQGGRRGLNEDVSEFALLFPKSDLLSLAECALCAVQPSRCKEHIRMFSSIARQREYDHSRSDDTPRTILEWRDQWGYGILPSRGPEVHVPKDLPRSVVLRWTEQPIPQLRSNPFGIGGHPIDFALIYHEQDVSALAKTLILARRLHAIRLA